LGRIYDDDDDDDEEDEEEQARESKKSERANSEKEIFVNFGLSFTYLVMLNFLQLASARFACKPREVVLLWSKEEQMLFWKKLLIVSTSLQLRLKDEETFEE
jgi:hypothetical protein